MNPPRLLVLKRLLEPARHAQRALAEIESKLPTTASESIELRGFFVLTVSALETMLMDTYVYYLRSYPEAFDFRDTKFSKDDLLAANLALDLIEQQVEKNAIAQAYESFPDLLKTITKTLGIAEPPLDPELIDRMIEIKEARNLLLHNSLRVNRRYVTRAGKFRRADSEFGTLPLTREYVQDACQSIGALIQELQIRLCTKFASFTRLAAMRRLWDYLFSSPIMPFEDFWVIDENKDTIFAIKHGEREDCISSSERVFLAVWRANFNGWKHPSGILPIYSLDAKHKQKMLWFLATLADFDVR